MPLGGRRILIVEDDPRLGSIIKEMISEKGGVAIGHCESVADALERMGDVGHVSAVVLDIGLVGEESYPLAAALKRYVGSVRVCHRPREIGPSRKVRPISVSR